MKIFIAILIDLIVVLCGYFIIKRSMKVGAAKTIIQIAGIVVAFALIGTLSNVLSESIYNGFVKEKIISNITETVDNAESDYKTAVKKSLPKYIINSADLVGVDINKVLNASDSKNSEIISENIEKNVFKPILITVIKLILVIILILVSVIIIKLLSKLTLVLNKIPIIKTANKGLGMIFGVLKAAILLTFVCSIIMYIAKNYNVKIDVKMLENTFIFKCLCDLNFLF